MRLLTLSTRALVLAVSLFSCAAWCQNNVTPGIAPLIPPPALFAVMAASDAPSADQAAAQRQVVRIGTQAVDQKAAAGSSILGANVRVNSLVEQVCDAATNSAYDQASWWFWYVVGPCEQQQQTL